MKIQIFLVFFLLVLSYEGYTQKKPEKFIFASSSLNYYPELESYSFFETVERNRNQLILSYLTSNSGTFVVDTTTLVFDRETANKFPTQIFNLGASVQIRKENSSFHEISISRFSSFKSSFTEFYTFFDTMGDSRSFPVGYKQKSFIMSLRYEYGKMFGDTKSNLRFGLSGVLEPSIYFYKKEVLDPQNFPIKATIFTLNVAIAPTLSYQLSKKVFLDFKIVPRFLLADFGNVEMNNPTFTLDQRKGEREYNLPEIDIAGTIQFRYLLKEPKKRRRRSRG